MFEKKPPSNKTYTHPNEDSFKFCKRNTKTKRFSLHKVKREKYIS